MSKGIDVFKDNTEIVSHRLLQILREHQVLNPAVIQTISKYLKMSSTKVKLVSVLRIESTEEGGSNSQLLHLDHIEGPHREVIMAISLKPVNADGELVYIPHPTSTIYFDKSHKHKTNKVTIQSGS